ncbi:unnamed protein product, partial [marine sediment metagenome]
TYCENLTACGEIQSGSKVLLDLLSKMKMITARSRVGSHTVYLRILSGGKSGKHLHINFALDSFFPKGEKPKVTHKKAEIMALLNEAIGAKVDVDVIGYFELPIEELPERGLVRSLYTEQKTDGIAIKLVGGKLTITGAPVRYISWSVTKDGKKIGLRIEAGKKGIVEIDEMYLQNHLDWINSQFRLFILTRGEYANK